MNTPSTLRDARERLFVELHVVSHDRLARSEGQLLAIVKELEGYGVATVVVGPPPPP